MHVRKDSYANGSEEWEEGRQVWLEKIIHVEKRSMVEIERKSGYEKGSLDLDSSKKEEEFFQKQFMVTNSVSPYDT